MNRKIMTALTIIFIIGIIFAGCDNFNLIELLNHDISIIPEEITLSIGETVQFEVSAGISPFTFTEIGDGSIPYGIYTAPGTAGSYTILVEDGRNRTAEAEITVVDPVTQILLTPQIVNTGVNGTTSYTISGGTPDGTNGYTITVLNSLGSIVYDPSLDPYSFDYIAKAVAGNDVIQVSDTLGQIGESYISITNSSDLMISPKIVELLLGETVQFSASGGTTFYTYSLISGDGTFVPATRIYTAPASMGSPTAVVSVDDTNTVANATIYIVENTFSIIPTIAITMSVDDVFTFSASNGVPPYKFSIFGNEPSGSIDSGTGLFTALIKDNNVTVVVEDSRGTTDSCRVKIKN